MRKFTFPFSIAYSDTDAGGIVYHGRYIEIAERLKKIEGVEFMWITDGWGWKKAKKNLQEAYIEIRRLHNIKDMEEGLFKLLV